MNREEYFTAELARYKQALDEGYHAALLDAFRLCVTNELPLPDWVWGPVAEQIETNYAKRRGGGGKKGRTGGRLAADEVDRIHYFRWAWASHWLANRTELPALAGLKSTRDGAFEYTAQFLRGHAAQGSVDAIKYSYKLVERAKTSGKLPHYEAAADDTRR